MDAPWYPADVRAHAIPGLAELFTTNDNYLYPFKRYPQGHEMSFVLRPGERMIRYFQPEPPGVFYLPYQYDGSQWQEVPQEFKEYNIKTADGPHSQKDARAWATGKDGIPPSRGCAGRVASRCEWYCHPGVAHAVPLRGD